ncbi:SDR family oxidoreductase [Ruminococcaceae bacterium OttesenSCG-928-N02]|nr:SDR family oxidoreductase [Ruminococcaceae bacterium OttesenSCG-928-N02]
MSNNIYLITGASGDMGIAFIRYIYKTGDIILAQGSGELTGLFALAAELGKDIHVFDADLSTRAGTERFLAALQETGLTPTHFLHLPALRVINARMKNFDFERYELDMNVEVTSAILLSKWLLPQMAKAGFGRVVFMLTSYIIGVPPKNVAAYVTAKSALEGLAKSLAVEFVKNGVTVNCVSPSMVETAFLADTSDLVVQAAAQAHPMGRNAKVGDVIPAIAFLMSEEARFITGVNLPITGGSVF